MSKLVANSALVLGLVQAVIGLLAAFGVEITKEQTAAILGVSGALIAVAAVWFHPSVPIGPQPKP